ncbi:CRISPR-associated endonuclease Cas2 [Enemella evansiae]|uniref:CRISPR-associated endonuclease Cas2 n=1 Tax=Enemella evansiae TaxID=2016499 RepID=UPI0015C61C14|nr:CRISPR-associated endonuclease Cas2 [Enemella evansiae]
MTKPRTYLIAYDVTDDRRRERLAQLLGTYGDRIQFGVFLIRVKPARIVRLTEAMTDLVSRHEDSVLICDLDEEASNRITFHGKQRHVTPHIIVF